MLLLCVLPMLVGGCDSLSPEAAEALRDVGATLNAATAEAAAAAEAQGSAVTPEPGSGGLAVSATPAQLAQPTKAPDVPGTIGRLAIPSLGIDQPIVEVSWRLAQVEGQTLGAWDTATGAVGHHRGSAAIGEPGNTVLSGHSRAEEGAILRGIEALVPGDVVQLADATGKRVVYVVSEVAKLEETGASLATRQANAAVMAPTDDARVTLITFWPDWAYTHRIVVVATQERS